MKKIKFTIIVLHLILLINGKSSLAASVNEYQARSVAENFMKSKTGIISHTSTLHYRQEASDGSADFYVFNFPVQKGFVIVAGDDRVKPVIAYSTDRNFDITAAKKSGVSWWMNKVKMQMQKIKKDNIQAKTGVPEQWKAYQDASSAIALKSLSAIPPLLETQWDQSPDYNALCPSNGNGGLCPTGCVATAMAQVMKYWNYPPHGTGSYSYTDSHGSITGTHSVNLGNTNYNWSNMPLTTSSPDIATLMYHCGVSVGMDYESNESGACVFAGTLCALFTNYSGHTSRDAFHDQFGYNIPNGQTRAIFLGNWVDMLKDELNLRRPIMYSGVNFSGGAHVWVCDGYDNNDAFHMNWGWGGSNNAYYDIDDLTPGSNDFNDFEGALIEIRPANLSACNTNWNLSGTQTTSYYIWQASNFINSTKLINNKFASYRAENYITLKQGFEAKGNTIDFVARLEPCSAPRYGSYSSIDDATDENEPNISVYPNPANNLLFIISKILNETSVKIKVTDVTGRILISYIENAAEGIWQKEIDLSGFAKGIYLLHVETGDGMIGVRRFVKE